MDLVTFLKAEDGSERQNKISGRGNEGSKNGMLRKAEESVTDAQ